MKKLPFVENSKQTTRVRVALGNISDAANELMNRLELLELRTDKGKEELCWLCAAIDAKYNAGSKGNIYDLPSILAAKAIEYNDGKLLLCASDIARALNLPMLEIKKLIENHKID